MADAVKILYERRLTRFKIGAYYPLKAKLDTLDNILNKIPDNFCECQENEDSPLYSNEGLNIIYELRGYLDINVICAKGNILLLKDSIASAGVRSAEPLFKEIESNIPSYMVLLDAMPRLLENAYKQLSPKLKESEVGSLIRNESDKTLKDVKMDSLKKDFIHLI